MMKSKLIALLQDTAGHKDNGCELSGKEARQLLEMLELEWTPEIEKGEDRAQAIRAFKKAVRERWGSRDVAFSLTTEKLHGKEHVFLHMMLRGQWPHDEVVGRMFKASGLSRHFVRWGSGYALLTDIRDISFMSKRANQKKSR